ncbi:MAG: cyclic nucleotide-binding domain-containing protein, partial [Acidimicrobiia bacterium]
MKHLVARRLLALGNVPPRVVLVTALASYVGLALAGLQGWPLWGMVLATASPWIPLLFVEVAWTYRHYQWLALLYLLVLTQGGHVVEHIAQMVQIHVLRLRPGHTHGIFGALDIEWVHFIWNTWILAAVVLLIRRFRRNPWLWASLAVAGWHEAEHVVILAKYLATGQQGTPGLLATGGAIAGGVLPRPDLHFLYNLVETVPLVGGFVYQLRRSHNEWLARALPDLPTEVLIETTNRLEPVKVAVGETVVRQGQPADRFYIIARGELDILRDDGDGAGEAMVGALGPGQFFGEIGLLTNSPRTATVRARGPAELLALDRTHFEILVAQSKAGADELTA